MKIQAQVWAQEHPRRRAEEHHTLTLIKHRRVV